MPDDVHLAFLAPDSAERQPAEWRWGPLDEPVTDRTFARIAELEDVLAEQCRALERQRPAIRSRGRSHW